MEKKKLDLSKYAVRTDLAVEARDLAEEKEASPKKELKGFTVKEYEKDGIKIQTMDIDEEGAKLSGKKAGRYLTFETQGIRQQDS
ncbi:GPR endopeptidase, partial [Salmonella enterica subsp. enterica serovar Typhimurium]|nr:GPR endopeptidase [Salmonella enterica subsp. enterica serovar Typhimurium]